MAALWPELDGDLIAVQKGWNTFHNATSSPNEKPLAYGLDLDGNNHGIHARICKNNIWAFSLMMLMLEVGAGVFILTFLHESWWLHFWCVSRTVFCKRKIIHIKTQFLFFSACLFSVRIKAPIYLVYKSLGPNRNNWKMVDEKWMSSSHHPWEFKKIYPCYGRILDTEKFATTTWLPNPESPMLLQGLVPGFRSSYLRRALSFPEK